MSTTVHLGFELGTGEPVSVPVTHTVVTGQTQASGKTTTLEAMVARSGLRAIAFTTKRNEGSFTTARRVRPYFREKTDWQFVASMLEATMRERFKYERPWIVKVSKGARTLRDVQRNVTAALAKTKGGRNHDVYLMLGEYLGIVLPRLESVRWADRVELQPGLNVMDLSDQPMEVQSLVIGSVLEWVNERETDTVVVIPEAWEFIPQQRASPVKLAAEQLIRKGGASRLFMWLDSQDIAAVDKSILKSPGLWIMGIQREANEVKRVLAHVSGRKKPAPDQVMDLSRGEFYACWSGNMRHVYVQPAWMDAEAARQIATGERPRSSVPAPVAFHRADTEPILPAEPDEEPDEEEEMDAKEIAREVARELRALLPDWREAIGCAPAEPGSVPPEEAVARNRGHFDEEALYQRFKARLAHEAPTLLRVLLQQSEIEVEVQRHTIKVDGDSLRGRIARLIKAGFFESPKSANAVNDELLRTGKSHGKPNVYKEVDALLELGFFVVAGEKPRTYQTAPGAKGRVT